MKQFVKNFALIRISKVKFKRTEFVLKVRDINYFHVLKPPPSRMHLCLKMELEAFAKKNRLKIIKKLIIIKCNLKNDARMLKQLKVVCRFDFVLCKINIYNFKIRIKSVSLAGVIESVLCGFFSVMIDKKIFWEMMVNENETQRSC